MDTRPVRSARILVGSANRKESRRRMKTYSNKNEPLRRLKSYMFQVTQSNSESSEFPETSRGRSRDFREGTRKASWEQ